jgi:hypothetical protein
MRRAARTMAKWTGELGALRPTLHILTAAQQAVLQDVGAGLRHLPAGAPRPEALVRDLGRLPAHPQHAVVGLLRQHLQPLDDREAALQPGDAIAPQVLAVRRPWRARASALYPPRRVAFAPGAKHCHSSAEWRTYALGILQERNRRTTTLRQSRAASISIWPAEAAAAHTGTVAAILAQQLAPRPA